MQELNGFIEVTAIRESGDLPADERRVLISGGSIVSVEETGREIGGRTRILVARGAPAQGPWIFRGEGELEPAETREFVVKEEYGVVRMLVGWAHDHAIVSERDYHEFIARAVTLQEKIKVGPVLPITTKPGS